MAELASSAIGYLLGLGCKVKEEIKNKDKPFNESIQEVTSLLTEGVHERVLIGYALLLWFTDKVELHTNMQLALVGSIN